MPQVSGELELEYAMPIHVPMVDVHTIGAGGGRSPPSMPPACCASARRAPAPGGADRVRPRAARNHHHRTPTWCWAPQSRPPARCRPSVTLEHVRGVIERDRHGPSVSTPAPRRHATCASPRLHGRRHASRLAVARPDRATSRCSPGGGGALHATALAASSPSRRCCAGAPRHHQCAGLRRRRPAHDYVRTVNKPLSQVKDGDSPASIARRARRVRRRSSARLPCARGPARHSADMQFRAKPILSVAVDRPDIGVEGLAHGLSRRLRPPLRHRAGRDPAGDGQFAHRGDRRATG